MRTPLHKSPPAVRGIGPEKKEKRSSPEKLHARECGRRAKKVEKYIGRLSFPLALVFLSPSCKKLIFMFEEDGHVHGRFDLKREQQTLLRLEFQSSMSWHVISMQISPRYQNRFSVRENETWCCKRV